MSLLYVHRHSEASMPAMGFALLESTPQADHACTVAETRAANITSFLGHKRGARKEWPPVWRSDDFSD